MCYAVFAADHDGAIGAGSYHRAQRFGKLLSGYVVLVYANPGVVDHNDFDALDLILAVGRLGRRRLVAYADARLECQRRRRDGG